MPTSNKVIGLKFEKRFSQSSTFRSCESRKILTIYLQSRIAELGNYALWTAEWGKWQSRIASCEEGANSFFTLVRYAKHIFWEDSY